jgi:uncharacterized membrane protein
MRLYLALKALHILSAMLFFGTGLGSAWYRLRADRSGDVRVIAWCQREIVLADWVFTVPSAVLLPASAVAMIEVLGVPWRTGWILWAFAGYSIAGLCWLPAAWLQILMRRLADDALASGAPLPPAFHRYARIWLVLGFPSFAAAMATLWLMVAKHAAIGD